MPKFVIRVGRWGYFIGINCIMQSENTGKTTMYGYPEKRYFRKVSPCIKRNLSDVSVESMFDSVEEAKTAIANAKDVNKATIIKGWYYDDEEEEEIRYKGFDELKKAIIEPFDEEKKEKRILKSKKCRGGLKGVLCLNTRKGYKKFCKVCGCNIYDDDEVYLNDTKEQRVL